MNQTICFYCNEEFEYDGEECRDVWCPFCKVMNSIYQSKVRPKETCQKCGRGDGEIDGAANNPGLRLCLSCFLEYQKGEGEMFNYNDEKYQGKYLYMPKIGEEVTIEIKEIREVKSDNPKFNFSEKVPVFIDGKPTIDDEGEEIFKQRDLGYHIECELVNGKILSVTNMAAFLQVFKKNNIQDAETWRIKHIDKGEWKCEKLG